MLTQYRLLPRHLAVIGASALHTVRMLATAWREILESAAAMDAVGAFAASR